ncbi:MAG: NAD-dependent epimerase/dehydratase family protein, partial [Woeseiaceae bacterium]|nr:NAD-dependent epimerase/dehydratase family protein [Woeseiaceae bacterium]
MTNRREFIIRAAGATSAIGLGLTACSREQKTDADPVATTPGKQHLNILILGGTGFIGPHMVRYAQSRGHTVTLFNRGRTDADLFPDVTTLIGDRDSQLDALESGSWDAVIDNSGFIPRHVRESAELLSSRANHYLFISSISAYADLSQHGIEENFALGQLADETDENLTGETYGPMKALAERYVQAAFPEGATIVRPGFIVGPGDRSDRWTYWPLRVRAGGEMIAPGAPSDPVQFIDARDLAVFVIGCLENRTLGAFNATGPAEPLSFGEMLETMKKAVGANP